MFLTGFILIILYFYLFPAPDVELFENFEDDANADTSNTTETMTDMTSETKKCTSDVSIEKSGQCSGGCSSNAKGGKLLPVFDPRFNMREICKQCVLLENHLALDELRCEDCIKKHILFIEGLGEEGITLDKDSKYKNILTQIPKKCRELSRVLLSKSPDYNKIQQEFRKIRKHLMPQCFGAF